MRVIYGGLLIDVEISSWLYLTVLSSSFYLILGKRKSEFMKEKSKRKVLKYYSESFFNNYITVFLSLIFVFYSLWVVNSFSNHLFKYSIILLIVIFMRYTLDLEQNKDGDPVDIFWSDIILILLSTFYAIFCIIAIY